MTPPLPDWRPVIAADLREIAERLGAACDRFAGKRFLITGASGYLAAYLVETLAWLNDHARLSASCSVVCLVRHPVEPSGRLGHLLGRNDITFWQQDVSQPLQVGGRFDFIIHAASNASPRQYLADPLATIDANVTGTRHLLERARQEGVESFLYFSSGEIYGNVPAEHVPTPETYTGSASPLGERAVYTESKRMGETLCATYHRAFHLPVKIVRPFHIYGPGMRLDDGRVVADLLRNRLADEPLHLLSLGEDQRAFGYISDATVGFWLALLSDADGEAFNIGSDAERITIKELAHLLSGLREPTLPITLTADRPAHLTGTPSIVCPDISKARQRLGYEPQVRLRDGILRLIGKGN